VVLVDRDAETVARATEDLGPMAAALAGDVTDEARMRSVMTEAATIHGGIDNLINNAGLHSHEFSRPIAEMGVAKTRRPFEVNVMGTVTCRLAAEPFMTGRSRTSIVNIASAAAFQGGGYGTSKLAVIGVTTVVRAPFVRLTAFASMPSLGSS
jgi:3-oxoacyl-[acyl-carrier protein] reductase